MIDGIPGTEQEESSCLNARNDDSVYDTPLRPVDAHSFDSMSGSPPSRRDAKHDDHLLTHWVTGSRNVDSIVLDGTPIPGTRCCTQVLMDRIKGSMRSEEGFMGMTHALSAVAVCLAVLAFVPGFMPKVLGDAHPPFIVLLCLVLVGGALMPDLDNTNSSAESSLGFIGSGLSVVMRVTAPIVQNLVHTKYDKDLDNPHRGFYHTGVSAILMGVLCGCLCALPGATGELAALGLAFIGTHVALSTLLKKPLKSLAGKSGKVLGFLLPLVFSITVVAVLWFSLPKNVPYWEMGVAFGLGWLIHILGDMCTTQGVPVLWPVPIKGKMWFDVRLLRIKAGGVVENVLFTPAFLIIIVVSIVHLVMMSI